MKMQGSKKLKTQEAVPVKLYQTKGDIYTYILPLISSISKSFCGQIKYLEFKSHLYKKKLITILT